MIEPAAAARLASLRVDARSQDCSVKVTCTTGTGFTRKSTQDSPREYRSAQNLRFASSLPTFSVGRSPGCGAGVSYRH